MAAYGEALYNKQAMAFATNTSFELATKAQGKSIYKAQAKLCVREDKGEQCCAVWPVTAFPATSGPNAAKPERMQFAHELLASNCSGFCVSCRKLDSRENKDREKYLAVCPCIRQYICVQCFWEIRAQDMIARRSSSRLI